LGALVIYSLAQQVQHVGTATQGEKWGLHGIAQTLDEDESK